MARTLLKLGGSLLNLPNLRQVVQDLLQLGIPAPPVITVGGGAIVEEVRVWDQVHQLGEERAHWLALEAMGLNEQLLLALFPEWRLVRSFSQLIAAEHDGKIPLICSNCFFKWGEQKTSTHLPHSWETCSDSLAAWFAPLIEAGNLILVKSTPWPAPLSWDQAHQLNLVDACFSRAVPSTLKVNWVNARQAPLTIVDCRL